MPNRRQYTVGWVCALNTELTASKAFLTEEHKEPVKRKQNDANTYILGSIGEHNVVMACLPNGEYGANSAAAVIADLVRSFPEVRSVLMVGIAGGAPSATNDIRLGDVVVATPGPGHGGVVQYDFGKSIQDQRFVVTGRVSPPPRILSAAIRSLKVEHESDGNNLGVLVKEALERCPQLKRNYAQPDPSEDVLYKTDYVHQSLSERSDQACIQQIPRRQRHDEDAFAVHYGLVVSGNSLMEDAMLRDKYSSEKDVLCFEVEAFGMMNVTECAVIRGICDYSDTHKKEKWQAFAAMNAAAYASSLLRKLDPEKVQREKKLGATNNNIHTGVDEAGHLPSSQIHAGIEDWLAAPGPSVNAANARDRRHPGTGEWFLASDQFLQWKQGVRRHMWLHGMPGCGKTVLATTILDHVAALKDSITISFFFDFNDRGLQTLGGMLRSLLFQLHDTLAGLNNSNKELARLFDKLTGAPVSAATFFTCLKAMASGPRKIYIILDALDECSQRPLLLTWMRDLLSDNELGQYQLIATGRPEDEFVRTLNPLIGEENCLELDKEAVDMDIQAYVDFEIVNHPGLSRWNGNHTVQKLIRKEIGNSAGGIFRLAACQLESLYRCIDQNQIDEVLRALPKTLDEAYSRILTQIPPASKPKTIRLLQFLVWGNGPLVLGEAVDIVAMRPENSETPFDVNDRPPQSRETVGYCPSFLALTRIEKNVEHSTENIKVDVIHLSHFSIKEYLMRAGGSFIKSQATTTIKECCTAYLECIRNKLSTSSNTARPADFSFGPYAARNWLSNLPILELKVQDPDDDEFQYPMRYCESCDRFIDMIEKLFNTEPTASRWKYFLSEQQTAGLVDNHASIVSFICQEGLFETAGLVLFTADPSLEAGPGMTMEGRAYIATQRHSTASVSVLLHSAPGLLHSMRRGALKARYSLERLKQWGCSLEMIQMHIQHGQMSQEELDSALSQAARQGHCDLAGLLLGNGADANATAIDNSTPLKSAIRRGHARMVELLLENGVDVNAVYIDGSTPLCIAVDRGLDEMVEFLLRHGAKVNATSASGFTPLGIAVDRGNGRMARILIKHGADVNAKNQTGRGWPHTPSEHNTSTDQHTTIQGTLLGTVISRSNQELACELLEQGAQIKSGCESILDGPLIYAVQCGNRHRVRLLLDLGANPNCHKDGYTALAMSAQRGHHEVVKVLLEHGASANAEDARHVGAFHAAVFNMSDLTHQAAIVKLLVMNGAKVDESAIPADADPQRWIEWRFMKSLDTLMELPDLGDFVSGKLSIFKKTYAEICRRHGVHI
ncbi:hypothetical protein PpBr36_05524 [Pyricularia pennisetigena]|uniref:hypothetical protein n=1 Tax=Pyricularia pennisetigena TaxID=1578925 RepID=UPI001151BCFF|nr:hypothetical protein PpBr36_05524 [Pyricularia pennisetigena]TLS27284.1 hypothetical protein PpBr36_05524 [Pyricularia pennisetigena]